MKVVSSNPSQATSFSLFFPPKWLLSCHATFLSQHWHFCILILIFYCTVCRFYILNYFIFNYFIYMYRILGCFCRNELFYWIHLCIWLSGCLIKGHFSAKTVFSALFDCSTHTHQLFSTSVKSILYKKNKLYKRVCWKALLLLAWLFKSQGDLA